MTREDLTKARESMGLNKSEFARLLGVNPSYLSLLESGEREITDAIRYKVSQVAEKRYNSNELLLTIDDPLTQSLEAVNMALIGKLKKIESRISELEKSMKEMNRKAGLKH